MDKNAERQIFDQVFGGREFESLIEREEPDFVCSSGAGINVGVEVTELHSSESDARLRRIDGYVSDLIAGSDHRHKDDIGNIEVTEIEIFRPSTGESTNAKAIGRDVPARNVAMSKLADSINAKEKKLENYRSNAGKCCLIIDDVDRIFRFDCISKIVIAFWSGEYRDLILNSGFSEIYLVTSHEKDGAVVIPLRGILLVAEITLFEQVYISHFESESEEPTIGEMFVATAGYLVRRIPNVLYWAKDNQPFFQLGGLSMSVVVDQNREIVETVFEQGAEWKAVASEVEPLAGEIWEKADAKTKKGVWCYQIYFKAKKTTEAK